MTDSFIGEIRIFGFNFPPRNWAFCNGQTLAIASNMALFSLLGTTFGGDGVTTFQLPNLQSRQAMHAGQGPGLTNRSLGEQSGAESVTLGVAQMPVHSHTAQAASTSNVAAPAGAIWGASTDNLYGGPVAINKKAAATGPMDASGIGSTGSGLPHENRSPGLALNFSICLFGIFPSRN